MVLEEKKKIVQQGRVIDDSSQRLTDFGENFSSDFNLNDSVGNRHCGKTKRHVDSIEDSPIVLLTPKSGSVENDTKHYFSLSLYRLMGHYYTSF